MEYWAERLSIKKLSIKKLGIVELRELDLVKIRITIVGWKLFRIGILRITNVKINYFDLLTTNLNKLFTSFYRNYCFFSYVRDPFHLATHAQLPIS